MIDKSNNFIHFICGLLFVTILCFANTSNARTSTAIINASSTNSTQQMLVKTMPAIVNITVQGKLPQSSDPLLKKEIEQMGQDTEKPKTDDHTFNSVSSGVIIDAAKGYIVTNAHSVDFADSIVVGTKDGRHFIAHKVGMDRDYDIALIQIKADHLTALPIGDSSKLKVGESVLAIGSPFGLSQTVTSGIISALHRDNLGIEKYENFIQTDAPINVGNSGGALVNENGQLIGINTAILSPSKTNDGIGFAIPINSVKTIIDQLIKNGHVARGLLGVVVQNLTPEMIKILKISNKNNPKKLKGVVVAQVKPYSAAFDADIKVADVITKLNHTPVIDAGQLRNLVSLLPIGKQFSITLIRHNKIIEKTAKTEKLQLAEHILKQQNPYLNGLTMTNTTRYNASFGLVKGIKVVNVDYASPASVAGIAKGDIILSANNQATINIQSLVASVNQGGYNNLLLKIMRDGNTFFLTIRKI